MIFIKHKQIKNNSNLYSYLNTTFVKKFQWDLYDGIKYILESPYEERAIYNLKHILILDLKTKI